jgi:hypothetical protein
VLSLDFFNGIRKTGTTRINVLEYFPTALKPLAVELRLSSVPTPQMPKTVERTFAFHRSEVFNGLETLETFKQTT